MNGAVVENEDHVALQREVEAHFKERGFLTGSLAYHDALKKSEELRQRISRCDTWTTLGMRGAADGFAIHPVDDLCASYEIKTVRERPGRANNIVIEALPLARHIKTLSQCLYVVRLLTMDGQAIIDGGFWTPHQVPPIDTVVLPNRWSRTRPVLEYQVRRILKEQFPHIEFFEPDRIGGSNDPFIKINPQLFAASTIPWKVAIDSWINTERIKLRRLVDLLAKQQKQSQAGLAG